jgi:hypothetical protein
MKSAVLISLLAAVIIAGPCPDENDPGCCLQNATVTSANGTLVQIPLGYDATTKSVIPSHLK